MSGSYDRPGGPSNQPLPYGYEPYEGYDEPLTGPPSGRPPRHFQRTDGSRLPPHQHPGYPAPPGERYGQRAPSAPDGPGPLRHDPPGQEPGAPLSELEPPTRGTTARREPVNTPIVEAGSVTGRSLTLVITIMCFLACLTAGAVYMINQSASAWLRDIASEVTVQIEPRDKVDTERTMREVATFLSRQPGVRAVRPLSLDDSSRLLDPWLGSSEALKSLPLPRLIALELDRTQTPDIAAMRAGLTRQFKGVSIDDHRQWQQQIRTVTRSFALGGLAILLLVGAATMAIIVSATRSAMASNREIVEVLHFVGATDRFIAREFEKHFLRLGVRAGLVGAASAMAVFVLMPTAMELLGGGTVTIAELRRLVGTGTLDGQGFLVLGLVVVVIAALCMITSRMSVHRILHTQP
jgi:cell division transport system permease protein